MMARARMGGEMPESRAPISAGQVAAVVAGNALEFYDLYIYSFFAVYIGRVFFPSKDPAVSLLASLGTYGLGFVMRPIGGWVLGRIGDRAGRKPAMILCFWLTGVALAGVALTPSYGAIGVAAPALVIFFRLLHGFALGGEVGPTTAFLVEAAPPERRGFYGSFQLWTQSLAILLSGIVGVTLSNTLTERQLQDFGWRIAFLLGVSVVPVGLMMRRRLSETLPRARGKTQLMSSRPYKWVAILGLFLLCGPVGQSLLTYMTTYALSTLHMSAKIAFAPSLVTGVCGVSVGLIAGAVSDHIGRKPVMIFSGILLILTIVPAFQLMAHYRNTASLLGGTAVLACLRGICAPVCIVWLAESLPLAVRSRTFALVYSTSVSLFGGTTQYVVTWLTKATGNPIAPAWYWTAGMAVSLAAAVAIRESAPRKLAATAVASPELTEA